MKYYLHDSNSFHDEKIYRLYMEYGYEGLGLFYTFLEKIAQQEKPVNEDVIKKQLNIRKRLQKVWDFMKEIELISIKNGEVFNENLLNFAESYQIKKEKTRKKVSEWRDKQKDSEIVTDYVPVSNPSKVKLSKVKLSKVKKIKYAEFVSMTKEEYEKLVSEYGETPAKGMINILDNYKGAKGKRYKEDYRAILSWVVGKYKEENPITTDYEYKRRS